ncbi:hypothetical protein Q1695_012714 [Nippostrongylus brasiliensis]|nr:hypothetical protein Q1695_012714 [Nippostrongylus brasiliensis]
MAARGALIVFEGLDRSGKSTQAKLLRDKIIKQNREAVLLPFPDRQEPFGQVIDRYLRNEINLSERALHLAFSANRWEKACFIKDKIKQGVDVICDRYCFSGIAYSIAKGLDSHWVCQADVGLPHPDVVLFFEVSPEVARQRGGYGDERLENDQLQQAVHGVMKHFKEGDQSHWQVIDADKSMDKVESAVWNIYTDVKEKTLSEKPLRALSEDDFSNVTSLKH